MTPPAPAPDLTRLVQAILTRVREREGYATKTKLVKYLYLLDLAAYRRTGRPLTDFGWIFHHYGPWAPEYEALYREAARSGAIRVRPGTKPDIEAEFVETEERVDLADLIDDVVLGLEARRIVDTWADRRLGEMLDYVYFRTEPMESAERGQPLDFSMVERGPTSPPEWQPPKGDRAAVERLRRRLAARRPLEARLYHNAIPREVHPPPPTPPRYDAEYYDALRILDEEERA